MEAAVREAAGDEARIEGVTLDLASLESVRSFSTRLKGLASFRKLQQDGLDVLVNNAGVMAIPEERRTEDGFERQVGTNYLGHFALTASLLPLLRRSGRPFRVVNVSSAANNGVDRAGLEKFSADATLDPQPYSQWGNYCASKAMNILYSKELQRRFDAAGVEASAVSLHPGAVATDLGRYLLGGSDATSTKDALASASPFVVGALKLLSGVVLPVDEGANTQVFLASSENLAADGGLYFDKMRPAAPNPATEDADLAARLWSKAVQLTGADYGDL
mmetsp:Transcript_3382/g.13057  ORF Transcript_3382/g.13057 Transcript_3382/m.13057 type:complete len:276 (-) Transcript_3382:2090-2917(-)